MEEIKKDHEHGMCCHGGMDKHFLLRWALGIAILFFAFWVGIKIGELKMLLRSEFGYGYGGGYYMQNMMRGYNSGYPMMYYYPQMMQWQRGATAPSPTPAR